MDDELQYVYIIDPKTGSQVEVDSERFFEILQERGQGPRVRPPIDPDFVQPTQSEIIQSQANTIDDLRQQVSTLNLLVRQRELGYPLDPKYTGDVSMYSSPILSDLQQNNIPGPTSMQSVSPRVSPRGMTPQIRILQQAQGETRGRSPQMSDASSRREISPQRVSPTGSYYGSPQRRGTSPRRSDFYDSSPRQRDTYRSPTRSIYQSSPPRSRYRSPPRSRYRSPPRSGYRSPQRGRYGGQMYEISCELCDKYIYDEESEVLTDEPKDQDYYRKFADVCSDCRRNARRGFESQGLNPELYPGYIRHVRNEAYALSKYANSL